MDNSHLVIVSDESSVVDMVCYWAKNQNLKCLVYSNLEWAKLNEQHNPNNIGNLASLHSIHEKLPSKSKTITELEYLAIEKAIQDFNGNLTEVAKVLGLGRATLYRKVKQHNINLEIARKKTKVA